MLERAKIAAIALAFLALFGFLIFQAGVAAKYPQAHHQQAATAQDHEQKNIFERFWEWTTEDPVAVYTLVLAVSTIGLWAVTGQGMRNQSREVRILQRAYISVEPGGISASKPAKQCHPNIVIRNAGNLPARGVKWTIDWLVSDDARLPNFPIDATRAEGQNTLPPGGVMMQGGRTIDVGEEPGNVWRKVDQYLYIWGAVYYDDGFGGNERVTRFCHRYNCANLETLYSNIGPASFLGGYSIDADHCRFHRYGNDAT